MIVISWILALILLFIAFLFVSIGVHVIFGVAFSYASIALTIISTMLVAFFITMFGRGDRE